MRAEPSWASYFIFMSLSFSAYKIGSEESAVIHLLNGYLLQTSKRGLWQLDNKLTGKASALSLVHNKCSVNVNLFLLHRKIKKTSCMTSPKLSDNRGPLGSVDL